MKTYLIILAAALAVACSKPASVSQEALSLIDASSDAAGVEAPTEQPKFIEMPPAEDHRLRDAIEARVLEAMKKWAPASTMPDHDISHYNFIARDIAEVVADPKEAPFWKDDTSKNKTATLVAAVAFFEGRFWKHVDDGSCNDHAKIKSDKKLAALIARTGNCDGGWAVSLFQIHPEGGIVLTDDGEWKHLWDAPGSAAVGTKEMLADRRVAVRVAVHMLRKSLHRTNSLVGYTGEGSCPCPKAKVRFAFAESWWRKHPS